MRPAAALFNVLRPTNLNELLVALGTALLIVALQQLAQQADALLHLLDGIHSLRHFLHSFLVLTKRSVRSHSAQDQKKLLRTLIFSLNQAMKDRCNDNK